MLIGYRGAGKSAVARALSARLGWSAVHMDAEIERRLGASIAEYVAEQGWDAFRDVETQMAEELARRDGIIIDTGGGIITRPENMSALKDHGLVVWLRVSVDLIRNRIHDSASRPALTKDKSFLDEIDEVLAQRTPLYTRYASHIVDTDDLTVDEVADAICGFADEA